MSAYSTLFGNAMCVVEHTCNCGTQLSSVDNCITSLWFVWINTALPLLSFWNVALGATGPGRLFADQKLIFERSLKVLVLHYLKYIFKCFTTFPFTCLEALHW